MHFCKGLLGAGVFWIFFFKYKLKFYILDISGTD